uniref:tRNA exportin n=1 Tax=Strongyloides papillosus TaxID=174720 RepID=A0A0N5BBR7_STREA
MEKQYFHELHRVLSLQYYDTLLGDITYFNQSKCSQIIEHFTGAIAIVNNDKIKINISPTRFCSIGSFITQIIQYPIHISLRRSILEFYFSLYQKILKTFEVSINDVDILKIIFLHFYDKSYGIDIKNTLEEDNYIEDCKIRISSLKICLQNINRSNMEDIFNEDGVYDKIIYLFYKKAAYFFQFLIVPSVFCNHKEDVYNILNTSASMFESLKSYFNIMTQLDDFCFDDKVTNESLEKIYRTIKLMFSTILGDSIHHTLLISDYNDGVRYNLYTIIAFILKFTHFINKEKHIKMFKEPIKKVTRIVLKLCSLENIPSTCFDPSTFDDHRSQLVEMKEFLVSMQGKFNFLVANENTHLYEIENHKMEREIVEAFDVMEI